MAGTNCAPYRGGGSAVAGPRKVGIVNRTSARWFLVAFAVIGILTVIEGINDGFTLLNWVVVVVSVVFGGQAVWTLAQER
jgi:hypothetical protein